MQHEFFKVSATHTKKIHVGFIFLLHELSASDANTRAHHASAGINNYFAPATDAKSFFF